MTNLDAAALKELGREIFDVRGRRSQQVFATTIGTNLVTLRTWEKGERAPQLFRHIEALASEGVSLDRLRACAAITKGQVAA